MVLPVVTYDFKSWTMKKAKHQRIDAFELWCWRRLLRVPWTARTSIWREINPEILTGRTTLKLKLQYFCHLMWTADSLVKSLMLGKIEGRKKRGHQRMRWLDGITDAMDMNVGKLQEMVRDREAWHAAVHAVAKEARSYMSGQLNNNNGKTQCLLYHQNGYPVSNKEKKKGQQYILLGLLWWSSG